MNTRSALELKLTAEINRIFYGISNRNRNSFLFRVASAAGENRNIMIRETLAGKILNREDAK